MVNQKVTISYHYLFIYIDTAMKKLYTVLGNTGMYIFCRGRNIFVVFYKMLGNLHLVYCVEFWSSVLMKKKLDVEQMQSSKSPGTNERKEYVSLMERTEEFDLV